MNIRKWIRKFVKDERAIGAKAVIMIGVSFFLLAVVFPIAMTQVTGTNTTLWNAAVTTMFTTLLPILVIIGAAIKYLPTR